MAGTKFTPVRDQEFTFNYNYIYISYDSNPNVIDDLLIPDGWMMDSFESTFPFPKIPFLSPHLGHVSSTWEWEVVLHIICYFSTSEFPSLR